MNIKQAFESVRLFIALLAGLIALVELKGTGADGAAKKAEVLQLLTDAAKKALPPSYLPIALALAPIAIDILVTVANSTGFFTPSAAPSPEN